LTLRLFERLIFRQARTTLVVGILLVIISSSIQIAIGFIREERQIVTAVNQMVRMINDAAGKALYDIDTEHAADIIKGLLEYPMISKAELVDDFGVVLAEKARAGTLSKYNMPAILVGWQKRYEFALTWGDLKKPVGKLVIHLDEGQILTVLKGRAIRTLILQAVTILLLALILTIHFYYLVTSPISRLTRNIALVDMDDPLRTKLEVAKIHRQDELGLLAATGNELLKRFGASLNRARQAEREAREREAEVARYRDHLEELVRKRTDELERSTKELELKRRLADIGSLAAVLAHRLRTPLGAVRLAAFNLRTKLSHSAELEHHLANMDKKIAESDSIISNLLLYSTQVNEPAYSSFNLAAAIEECLATEKKVFPDSRIRIDRKFSAGDECAFEGDYFMIKELLSNILGNAYEAIGQAGTIEIGLDRSAADIVKIYVRDSGPGMSEDAIGKAFDQVFTTKINGMGIGLKICLQIARLHKGSLHIESAEGKGTTVSIILPVRRKA
jgi:signal transduction histidine kinase